MSTSRRRRKRGCATTAAAATSISKYNAAYAAKNDFIARPNAFLARCLKRIAATTATTATTKATRSAKNTKRAKQTSARTRRTRRTPRALDIGLGQGRNALLLAQRGYEVTGIDRSDVGVRAANRLAAARGVGERLHALVADTERFEYGRNRWDLIVLLYYPQPMILLQRLKRAVRPGGCIIVERFSNPAANNQLDKRDVRRPSPMLVGFADWHVLHYEHAELESDWHWDGESPRGPIVRLLARKPQRG